MHNATVNLTRAIEERSVLTSTPTPNFRVETELSVFLLTVKSFVFNLLQSELLPLRVTTLPTLVNPCTPRKTMMDKRQVGSS